jgi:hypothetical protein
MQNLHYYITLYHKNKYTGNKQKYLECNDV